MINKATNNNRADITLPIDLAINLLVCIALADVVIVIIATAITNNNTDNLDIFITI